MKKTKLLILLTVFIDVVGFGIVIPILPFYVSNFSTSPFVITSLFSVYAICSFFSAPLIGALSDRLGRRPMLIMSIASTSLGWFVFAAAPSLFLLFVGRIIDGLAAGNISIAQSYLTDLAKTPKERTENLGIIGAVFGVAFIFGPLFGGVLSGFGSAVPFWFVGGLASVNTVLAIFFLPETHINRTQGEKIRLNPFLPIVRAIKDKELRMNYLAWFLFGLAISSFIAVFALYLRDVFGFNEFWGGLTYTFVGVIVALNQGIVMRRFWLKHFEEPTLELGMLLGFAFGFVLLSFESLWLFMIGLVFTTFGQSVLRVVMTSQIAGRAESDRRGEALGVASSITSLSMAIGPIASGALYLVYRGAPFLVSALCLLAAFAVLYRLRNMLRLIPLSAEIGESSVI